MFEPRANGSRFRAEAACWCVTGDEPDAGAAGASRNVVDMSTLRSNVSQTSRRYQMDHPKLQNMVDTRRVKTRPGFYGDLSISGPRPGCVRTSSPFYLHAYSADAACIQERAL